MERASPQIALLAGLKKFRPSFCRRKEKIAACGDGCNGPSRPGATSTVLTGRLIRPPSHFHKIAADVVLFKGEVGQAGLSLDG
jgi:hypothetical protein